MALFSGKSATILIAEDDPSLRRVLGKKIETAGYKLLEAADGEQAIELALKEKPHLILLDELMPKFTGTAVIKRIRQDQEWGAKVPIFILTNVDEGTHTYQQVKDLADKYFIKSNTPLNDLLEEIKQTLAEKPS